MRAPALRASRECPSTPCVHAPSCVHVRCVCATVPCASHACLSTVCVCASAPGARCAAVCACVRQRASHACLSAMCGHVCACRCRVRRQVWRASAPCAGHVRGVPSVPRASCACLGPACALSICRVAWRHVRPRACARLGATCVCVCPAPGMSMRAFLGARSITCVRISARVHRVRAFLGAVCVCASEAACAFLGCHGVPTLAPCASRVPASSHVSRACVSRCYVHHVRACLLWRHVRHVCVCVCVCLGAACMLALVLHVSCGCLSRQFTVSHACVARCQHTSCACVSWGCMCACLGACVCLPWHYMR